MSSHQSGKHGSAIDDAMQDPRRQASAGTRHELRPEDDPVEGGATGDARSEIARFLGPAAFPGDASRLREVAADNDATDAVRRLLSRLPGDRLYETVQEVVDDLRSAS